MMMVSSNINFSSSVGIWPVTVWIGGVVVSVVAKSSGDPVDEQTVCVCVKGIDG